MSTSATLAGPRIGTGLEDGVLAIQREFGLNPGLPADVLALAETGLLAPLVGETFTGVVAEVHHAQRTAGEVLVRDHAIEAKVHGSEPLPLGEEISVRLVDADVASRVVRFESVTG